MKASQSANLKKQSGLEGSIKSSEGSWRLIYENDRNALKKESKLLTAKLNALAEGLSLLLCRCEAVYILIVDCL